MGGVFKGSLLSGLRDFVGANAGTAGGFTNGGFWYLEKDLRKLGGASVASPFALRYCGGGNAKKCATALWSAIDASGAARATQQCSPDPGTWRSNASKERISFAPGLLTTTIRYTNRPT